jgi:Uma2 family endonuclease
MATAAPELPLITDRTAFNLKRWDEVCADPTLTAIAGRFETDAFGQVIMNYPPAPEHGENQSSLAFVIRQRLPSGHIITECPVSTREGVKLTDVAWISTERRAAQKGQKAFTVAPEICIEVLSPSNTRDEIDGKKHLYFESGADEVWICGLDGTMRFFVRTAPDELGTSILCPGFPDRLDSLA